jgi:predicted DNA repair protein MutK
MLGAFAPWLIAPLLMLGGAYLCFEGAEKVPTGCTRPGDVRRLSAKDVRRDPAHLEEAKAKGAIKTDFILSAEIMTIALAAIETGFWMEAAPWRSSRWASPVRSMARWR